MIKLKKNSDKYLKGKDDHELEGRFVSHNRTKVSCKSYENIDYPNTNTLGILCNQILNGGSSEPRNLGIIIFVSMYFKKSLL
jgi:hypothetical protein